MGLFRVFLHIGIKIKTGIKTEDQTEQRSLKPVHSLEMKWNYMYLSAATIICCFLKKQTGWNYCKTQKRSVETCNKGISAQIDAGKWSVIVLLV